MRWAMVAHGVGGVRERLYVVEIMLYYMPHGKLLELLKHLYKAVQVYNTRTKPIIFLGFYVYL